MPVQSITSKEQFDALRASGKVIFVDFYADWCGPCKQISPTFQQLADEHAAQEGVEFYKVDIDAVPDIANALSIRSIPTFHAYKDGECVNTSVGANRAALTSFVTGLTRL